jgi:hypothetical protein
MCARDWFHPTTKEELRMNVKNSLTATAVLALGTLAAQAAESSVRTLLF